MDMDNDEIYELVEILQLLMDDFPFKVKEVMEVIITDMHRVKTVSDLLKIQDELEGVTNMANLDSFSRSEIMTVINEIESIVNS